MKVPVILYIPNLISYFRLILVSLAYYHRSQVIRYSSLLNIVQIEFFSLCIVIAAVLDIVDGFCARYFHQVSDFGAALDQVSVDSYF